MSKKGLPLPQIVNGRWRGYIPFRQVKADRKLLESQRRTGEPSPASWHYPDGYGKAGGSYTEKMRKSLWEWMNVKLGTWASPLTFEYRLYRRRTITVVGQLPYIKHLPVHGKGKRGFVLEVTVLSIDGTPCRLLLGNRARFSWDRIVAKEKFLALPQGAEHGK